MLHSGLVPNHPFVHGGSCSSDESKRHLELDTTAYTLAGNELQEPTESMAGNVGVSIPNLGKV